MVSFAVRLVGESMAFALLWSWVLLCCWGGGGGLASVGIAAAAPSLEMMAKGSKGGSASFVVLSGARLAEVLVE